MLIAALLPIAMQPQFAAWVLPWNIDSVERFGVHRNKLSEAMAVTLYLDSAGAVRELSFYDPSNWTKLKQSAKSGGVQLYLTINNYEDPAGFDSARMTLMLNNPIKSAAAISKLVQLANRDKATGVDLDFESMAAADRNAYSAFVAQLSTALHGAGRKLSVTVHPKQEILGGWDGPKSQDWNALGKSADVFRIMTYDYSWSTSPAGPIAPTAWVSDVARFAVTQVQSSKISMGISWYGYDWNVNPAKSLIFTDLPTSTSTIAPESGEMVFNPKLRFSGKESLQQKLAALAPFKLRGYSAWFCGAEDPRVWSLVNRSRVSESAK